MMIVLATGVGVTGDFFLVGDASGGLSQGIGELKVPMYSISNKPTDRAKQPTDRASFRDL